MPAVTVENVCVRYRTPVDKQQTLAQSLRRLGRRKRSMYIVDALDGVSFTVPHGSVTGIIGSNGAGKTTLMRTVAGIVPPDEGRVTVHGEITAMMSLGIGMKTQLTGRENIYLGCLARGLKREEIDALYPTIVEFAGIGEFIELPIRTYSSGMRGRLAFSVAVNVKPDIMLLDEALSAGDAAFKQKSFDKMHELCEEASTILLVSHGLGTIGRLCDQAVWLEKGKVKAVGEPYEVCGMYTDYVEVARDAITSEEDF